MQALDEENKDLDNQITNEKNYIQENELLIEEIRETL